ncbi:MAG: tetratricopeptide (TPR) repeat protein [Gammaproteobacteria bacterium]|jgi:tetratricopeptide (TPR) repeat protein
MRNNFMKILSIMANSLLLVLLSFSGNALSDSGDTKYEESPLNNIYQLIENKQFEQAILELNQADQDDADVANLLGYSNRKLENYDVALKYYQHALSINPEHKGANEYLGELYLETGEIDKAKQRLAILDDACFFPCSEYTTLKNSIIKYESNLSN